MNNLITIREYDVADHNEIVLLFELNTPKFFSPDEKEDLLRYLSKERELYYVLLFDQKIVGCGGINFEKNKTQGIISWDIFHPNYQGKNLGTKLMSHRLNKLSSIEGIRNIIVRTSQLTNKFYEKQGFELFEIKKDYWAEGFDMYSMEYNSKYKRKS